MGCYWLSDLELFVSYWLERGAQGISEYLILRLTRFLPCSWFLWSTFLFLCISSPPSKSPNEWWENCGDLEMLFSRTLSLPRQGTFHPQPRVDRGKDSLGWWGVKTDLCGVCSFLRERYKIAVFVVFHIQLSGTTVLEPPTWGQHNRESHHREWRIWLRTWLEPAFSSPP